MGKVRARTDEELAARKQEILSAAKDLLMTMNYESITLATIAEKTILKNLRQYLIDEVSVLYGRVVGYMTEYFIE